MQAIKRSSVSYIEVDDDEEVDNQECGCGGGEEDFPGGCGSDDKHESGENSSQTKEHEDEAAQMKVKGKDGVVLSEDEMLKVQEEINSLRLWKEAALMKMKEKDEAAIMKLKEKDEVALMKMKEKDEVGASNDEMMKVQEDIHSLRLRKRKVQSHNKEIHSLSLSLKKEETELKASRVSMLKRREELLEFTRSLEGFSVDRKKAAVTELKVLLMKSKDSS